MYVFFLHSLRTSGGTRQAAGVQSTAARLKDRVSRDGHHSKMKMDSQDSKDTEIMNSGFSPQTMGYDLLGAKISTRESNVCVSNETASILQLMRLDQAVLPRLEVFCVFFSFLFFPPRRTSSPN